MKAIHNVHREELLKQTVGNYKLKYNFESNSQHKESDSSAFVSW
nr:hypothetical protein [Flavobacterium psychrophilum]